MATNTLDIHIRALVDGLTELRTLQEQLRQIPPAAGGAGGALGGLGGPLDFLRDNVGKLTAAFLALVAAYGLKESADYAARTEVLGTTLNVVAKNAGYSGEQIAGYEKQVHGLGITTQATRESLTQMIQAGLELGPAAAGQVAQVAKLARAAQDLAVVTGENSSATLQRLITNITQLDSVGLRYMGLTVNIEQAQVKFAQTLGKTADQLTQNQKVQAVLNESLAQAAKLEGAYEASMENVGKKLQSIKRYQEDLADAVGAKLLPAYAALVDTATNFLKVSEQIVSSTDKSNQAGKALAEGTKSFFGAFADLLTKIIKIGAEALVPFAQLIDQLLELGGEVITLGGDILTMGGQFEVAGEKVSILGQLLSTIATTVGLFIASLRDGIAIIGVVVEGVIGGVLAILGVAIQKLGQFIGIFKTDFGNSIIAVGNAFVGTANEIGLKMDKTIDRFAVGKSAVGDFANELNRTTTQAKALAAATNFSDIEEQIRKLTEAKRQNTLTDTQLAASSKAVQDRINSLGGEFDSTTGKVKLTQAEVTRLSNALLNVTKDSFDQYTTALTNLGVKLQNIGGTDYLTPLNKQFSATSLEITKLAENANATSDVFSQAFSKGLDTAKTLGDLDALVGSLKLAANAGKDTGEAAKDVIGTFEKLFTAGLKAASSKDDFALLTAQVKQLGGEGAISKALMDDALSLIKDKADGATASLKETTSRTVELGKAALDVSKASLSVAQSDYDVGKARIDVWKAQNEYSKTGSQLAAETLRLAQLELQLAQARATEARAQYAEAQANAKVILATQDQILATKRLERDLDNESLILARDEATKRLNTETEVYQQTKITAEKQQEIVNTIQEQVLKQKLAVDQAQAQAEYASQTSSATAATSSSTASAATSMQTANTAAGSMSVALGSAAQGANQLSLNLAGASAQALAVQSALNGVAAAQARLDSAQGNNPGVTSFGTDKPVDFSKAGSNIQTSADIYGKGTGSNGGNTSSATNLMPVDKAFDISDKYLAHTLTKDDLADAEEAVKQAEAAAKFSAYASSQGLGSVKDDGSARILTNAREALAQVKRLASGGGGLNSNGYVNPIWAVQDAVQNKLFGNTSAASQATSAATNAASTATSTPVASAATTQAASASAPASSKTITVNFTNEAGNNVSMTADASDEASLLALLAKAKGVASVG